MYEINEDELWSITPRNEQCGRLFIYPLIDMNSFIKIIEVYVVPENSVICDDAEQRYNSNFVKVYGKVNGLSCWIHEGKWIQDFEKWMVAKFKEHEDFMERRDQESIIDEKFQENREKFLLEDYK